MVWRTERCQQRNRVRDAQQPLTETRLQDYMCLRTIFAHSLLTSAVRYSRERKRVVGILGWTGDAELDKPGERRRIFRRIESRRRSVSEPQERVDAVDE